MNSSAPVVEVVHIAECPNWADTAQDLRELLAELGHADIAVGVRTVVSGDDALAVRFAGSPTVLIDGVDPYPHGEPTGDLACRVYLTEVGLRGRPSRTQLRQLLVERLPHATS